MSFSHGHDAKNKFLYLELYFYFILDVADLGTGFGTPFTVLELCSGNKRHTNGVADAALGFVCVSLILSANSRRHVNKHK